MASATVRVPSLRSRLVLGPWKDRNCRSGPSCQDWEGLEEGPGMRKPPQSTQHLETIRKSILSHLSKNYHNEFKCL